MTRDRLAVPEGVRIHPVRLARYVPTPLVPVARRVYRALGRPGSPPRASGKKSAAAVAPPAAASIAAASVRSREELHAYWRDPDEPNRPEGYVIPVDRSHFLLKLLEPYCASDDPVLEIGPNVGRNLEHLRLAGFKCLEGIEINSNAIEVMRASYPDLAASATIHNAPVEEVIGALPDRAFGAVLTMAVLEHIHPESEWIFAEMVRICRGIIVTIEDEESQTWRHTPRQYRSVFEGLGMVQIAEADPSGLTGLGAHFRARVFQRPPR